MTIIGLHFTRIAGERGEPLAGNVSVNRQCQPTGVQKVTLGGGQTALRYTFAFKVEYTPNVGMVDLRGVVSELVPEKTADAVVAEWEKDGTIPAKSLEKAMNAFMQRCFIESLVLAKELNIPPPLSLPKITVSPKKAPEKTADSKGKGA